MAERSVDMVLKIKPKIDATGLRQNDILDEFMSINGPRAAVGPAFPTLAQRGQHNFFQGGPQGGLPGMMAAQSSGGGLMGLFSKIGEIGGKLGEAGSFFGMLKTGLNMLGPVGKAIIGIGTAAVAAAFALNKLNDALVALVAVANPAVAERNHRAWLDMQGVIGQRMVPILERVTFVVRTVGDALANILPPASEITKIMKGLDPALKSFRDITLTLAPILSESSAALFIFAAQVRSVGLAAAGSQGGALMLLSKILGQGQASSVGAAAQQASFSSLEGIGEQAQLAAFGLGAENFQEQTANNTARTNQLLVDIHAALISGGGTRATAEAAVGLPLARWAWNAATGGG